MDSIISGIKNYIGDSQIQAWIVAIIIIIAAAVISAALTRIIRRLTEVDGVPLPSSSILINIARIVVWAIAISIALSACFGIDVNGIIAALGIGGVAISLGTQDTIKNFIGGLTVTLMSIVRPGDHIIVNGVDGMVRDVSWRQTVVEDFEHNTHLIPNSIINSSTVTKVEPSLTVATMLSFTNDTTNLEEMIPEMERLAKEAIEPIAPLEKDPWILLTQIGEYGTWAKMRFVLKEEVNVREARDAALRAVSPFTRNNAVDLDQRPEQ